MLGVTIMKKTSADVVIIGGGLAGLTQALILGQNGVSVICLDKEKEEAQSHSAVNLRTTVISYGSHQLMKAAKIWNSLEPYACPIQDIHVNDGNSSLLLQFNLKEDVDASKAEGFGWVVENFNIRNILLSAIKEEENITLIHGQSAQKFECSDHFISVQTDENNKYEASLIIGADGRQSFTRQSMHIEADEHDYKQRAIVSIVTHENNHNNIAVENFRSNGPFAILPMLNDSHGNHRSSIVWTEEKGTKESIMDLDNQTYLMALRQRFPQRYGQIIQSTERFAYPLGLIHAHHYIAPRCALIGDAAHGIHPIAGQGLNLGLRDVAELTDLILQARKENSDFGSKILLNIYQKNRITDNRLMIGVTHNLNSLFSNNNSIVKLSRKTGLSFFGKIKPAKKIITKQMMGLSGHVPKIIKEGKI